MRRLLARFGILGIAILLWGVLLPGQAAPSAPSTPAAASQKKHQAKLKWNAPAGAGAEQPKGYIVYRTNGWMKDRAVNCGKKWRPIATTAAGVTEYTDDEVKPGDVYCYAVSAMTSKGETRKSFTASARIPSP